MEALAVAMEAGALIIRAKVPILAVALIQATAAIHLDAVTTATRKMKKVDL